MSYFAKVQDVENGGEEVIVNVEHIETIRDLEDDDKLYELYIKGREDYILISQWGVDNIKRAIHRSGGEIIAIERSMPKVTLSRKGGNDQQ